MSEEGESQIQIQIEREPWKAWGLKEAERVEPRILELVAQDASILRTVCEPVEFPLKQEDIELVTSMVYSIQPEQLKKAGAPWPSAAGMAANQWGQNKRIFLFGSADHIPADRRGRMFEVIFNPEYAPVTSEAGEPCATVDGVEGCFSVPGVRGQVKRFQKVQVIYQDAHGVKHSRVLSDRPARVWQHENDHLNGILYTDLTDQVSPDEE
jgi:peptide deformylase